MKIPNYGFCPESWDIDLGGRGFDYETANAGGDAHDFLDRPLPLGWHVHTLWGADGWDTPEYPYVLFLTYNDPSHQSKRSPAQTKEERQHRWLPHMPKAKSTKERRDVKGEAIADLVDKFVSMLERADHDEKWQAPWVIIDPSIWAPYNRFSNHRYTGGNVVILAITSMLKGYTTGLWAPYAAWVKAGMDKPEAYKPHAANESTVHIRKGERATTILKPNPVEREANAKELAMIAAGQRPQGAFMKDGQWFVRFVYFSGLPVFNIDQVEGFELPEAPAGPDPIAEAEAYFSRVIEGGVINFKTNRAGEAWFSPTTDQVTVPERETCRSAEAFYSVLAHELVHWTGGKGRLERRFGRHGTDDYKMEELVAELGAAFQLGQLGITSEGRSDHLPYIKHYIEGLRANPEILWDVAQDSQKAVDYLAGLAEPKVLDLATREDAAKVVV